MNTDPLQLISDNADGLSDIESALALLSRRVPEHMSKYVMGLATAARLLGARNREWVDQQPVPCAETADSDYGAFQEAVEHQL